MAYQVYSYQGGNCRERFLAFVNHLDDLQQQMRYQRTPYLRFYPVLCVRVEEAQLEVLFQFFEGQLDCPTIFINQSDLFRRYLPIVGYELVFTVLLILVVD